MTNPRSCLALAACLLALLTPRVCPAQDKPAAARPAVLVPRLAQAPTLDGDLAPGEWEGAALISGFIDATGPHGGVLTGDNSQIQLGHRDGVLYLSVAVALPPGVKPSMNFRRRDEPVFMDRYQLEVWLTPPTQGQVKAYQSCINAYGAIWDALHIPALGVVNTGWNGQWTVKSRHVTGEKWTAELSLPLADMVEGGGAMPAEGWGLLVAVAWPQRSWPYTQGWYKNIESHALMTLGEGDAAVRISGINSLRRGALDATFTAAGGDAKAPTVTIAVDGQTFTGQGDGRTARVTGDVPAGDPKLKRTAVVRVADAAGRVLLEGPWPFRVSGGEDAVVEDKQSPAASAGWSLPTRVNYAPEASGIRLWADVLDMPNRAALDHAHFAVVPADGDRPVVEATVRSFDYDAAEALLWLPKDLAPGKYVAVSTLRDARGNTLGQKRDEFTRPDLAREFVWLGNTRGKTITLAPPFEAVQVQGKDVSVWGRSHAFDGALPAQITSQGRALLARPVALVAQIDGRPVAATATQPWKLVEQRDTAARFEGRYEVAGLRLTLAGRLEFDGMIHYDLAATPGERPAALERLYLSIPVKPEHATTYFSTAGGWSASFGILDAAAPAGRVWSSDAVAPFVPYVGVGDDDRALQWFADTDATWVLGDLPCASIEKTADAVEMQVNLVRRAGAVTQPFTAAFGLIASPVRPLPAKWRNTSLDSQPHFGSTINFFYGPGHGGCPIDPHDTKTLAQVLGVDVGDRDSDAVLAELEPGSRPLDDEAIRKVLGKDKAAKAAAVQRSVAGNVRHCYFFNAKMYFEGNRSRAFRTFFPGDWQLDPHGGWFHLTPTESYDDFFAFHLDLWFKHWLVAGLYFDETYFAPDHNVFNGNGHVMPDGSVRPTVALMRQRANLQRMRQLFIDNQREPFLWVHTSNFMAPHAISAVDIAMFGEDRMPTAASDYIDTAPAALLRSIGRSQKFGFVPVWMDQAGRGGQHHHSRQVWGWLWMHDVVPEYHTSAYQLPTLGLRVAWGIDRDDVTFIPYWRADSGIRAAAPELIVSAWQHKDGGLLLQAMNLARAPGGPVQVTLDAKALGLPAGAQVYDLESAPAYRAYAAAAAAELAKPRPEQDAAKLRELLTQARAEQPWLDAADAKGLTRVGDPSGFNVTLPPREYRLYLVR